MNHNIIKQFELLLNQIYSEYIDAQLMGDTQAMIKHNFRRESIKRAYHILKKINFEIKSSNDVKNIPGLGTGSLKRIDEILKTGKLSEINPKDSSTVLAISELSSVIGIGEKKAKMYVIKYGIKSITELKKAYNNKQIKLDDKILLGLKYHNKLQRNIPRKEITDIAKYLKRIASHIDDELEIVMCGSYRRGLPTSGDIDVLMYHPLIKTLDQLLNPIKYKLNNFIKPFIVMLTENGFLLDHMTDKKFNTKYMGFCKYKSNPIRRIDIRIIPYESLYTSLLYFTGSKELNIIMRKEAIKRGMLLNEYGLYKDNQMINITSEEDIFHKLGMKYLPPTERNLS